MRRNRKRHGHRDPCDSADTGKGHHGPPPAADAASLIGKLEKADLGLTNVAAQDENTDPNNLIGRPGGYTSRASADLPGGSGEKYSVDRGLVVEVFAAM